MTKTLSILSAFLLSGLATSVGAATKCTGLASSYGAFNQTPQVRPLTVVLTKQNGSLEEKMEIIFSPTLNLTGSLSSGYESSRDGLSGFSFRVSAASIVWNGRFAFSESVDDSNVSNRRAAVLELNDETHYRATLTCREVAK